MANELYFIPILERALEAEDPREPLRKAFKTIVELGEKPDHKDGYRQFLRYMEEVARNCPTTEAAQPAGAGASIPAVGRATAYEFLLERDNHVIGTISVPAPSGRQVLRGIGTGHHVLSLYGSRVLWEADLREEQVLWRSAFPGRDLPAAAQTDESLRSPTREETLLRGEVILRLYPGMRSGVLDIEVREGGGDRP